SATSSLDVLPASQQSRPSIRSYLRRVDASLTASAARVVPALSVSKPVGHRGGSGLLRGGSTQQRAAVPILGIRDAGHCEKVSAAERLDIIGQRLVDQPRLDGLELALNILLETGEDVAGRQIPVRVDTQIVTVGPAHQLFARGVRCARIGKPDM